MLNSFDTDVAVDVGVNAAIIYKNIQFWCEKNRTNRQNEHEGFYWTYNSIQAFSEQFPYLSPKQIRSSLMILEEKGYIRSGNFNNSPYDRTKWYADIRVDMSPSTCPKGQMKIVDRENEIAPQGQPIPYINTDINTDISTSRKKQAKKEESLEDVMNSFPVVVEHEEIKDALKDFIIMRKQIKKPLTARALRLNINDAVKLSGGGPSYMLAVIEQSLKNSWQGFYALKDEDLKAQVKEDFFEKMLKEVQTDEERNGVASIEGVSDALSGLF